MKTFFLLIFLMLSDCVAAQESKRLIDEHHIESLYDNGSDDPGARRIAEDLDYLQKHPLNISRPEYSDLIRLPFVSPFLAESILLFCDSVPVTEIRQLRNVHLMTPEVFQLLSHFVTVTPKLSAERGIRPDHIRGTSRTRMERRLKTTKGFSEGKYLGDHSASYQLLRFENAHYEIACAGEKDIGERYSDGFISGYVEVKNMDPLVKIVAGNYTVSSSQGLVIAGNAPASKGFDAVGQIRKRGTMISPAVTTDEFAVFSGIASHWKFGNLSLLGFYSSRSLPASPDTMNDITSLFTSGIYRTAEDLRKRNILGEQMIGGIVEIGITGIQKLSFTVIKAEYDKNYAPSVFNNIRLKSITAFSTAWDAAFPNLRLFGETATNDGVVFSNVLGFMFLPSKDFGFSLHHRSFDKGYYSPYARPFGRTASDHEEENGNYAGIELKSAGVVLRAYGDIFSVLSPADFNSSGASSLLSLSIPVTKNYELAFQLRTSSRMNSDDRIQSKCRLEHSFDVTGSLSFTHRTEWTKISRRPANSNETGWMSFIQGAYRHQKSGIVVKSRMIFFDTPSYDSRLYQYESDVAGNYSNPPLYGKGIRWYVLAGAELFNGLRCSIKYSETRKLFATVLGSGDDQIMGNVDNRLALQLDFRM